MPTFNYLYSLPYILFFFYLFSLCIVEIEFTKNSKKETIIQIFVLAGLFVFIGLRGFIYTDWINYFQYYEIVPSLWKEDWLSFFSVDNLPYSGWEQGFIVYSSLIKILTTNYFAWVAISLIIDLAVLHFFFKQYSSNKYVLSFVVFYAFSGLILEVNLMRNAKAIMLFLVSIRYLSKRKIIPYMILNVVGCFFHISSILYIPFYFLSKRIWPKYWVLFIFIIGNAIFLLQVEYIKPILLAMSSLIGGRIEALLLFYLNMTSDSNSASYGITIGYLERFLTFCLVYVLQNKLVKQNEDNVIFINAFYIYISIYLFFSEMSVILERVPILFVFSYWILYPQAYVCLSKNRLSKVVFLSLLFVYISLKLVVGNSTILSRYDNLLFGIESLYERAFVMRQRADELFGK